MKEIKRIEAGCYKAYKRTPEHFEESELNIDFVLGSNKQSTMHKSVKRLVDAGATKVTIRGNPLSSSKDPYAENFYIFTGYK